MNEKDAQILEPGKRYKVPVSDGYLEVIASIDKDYPGLDVEYIPDNENSRGKSNPRILFESTPTESGKKLRALIWDDKDNEDYTKEIVFHEE